MIDRIFGPSDPVVLDGFTRCFALSLLVYLFDRCRNVTEWLTAVGFHPTNELPTLPAPFPLLPEPLAVPFAILACGAAAALVLIPRSRALCGLLCLIVVYVSFADLIAAFSLNKVYITTLAILAVRPRRIRTDAGEIESGWVLRMLQLFIVQHYFVAGVCKLLHGDWLVDGGVWIGDGFAPVDRWYAGRQHDVLLTHLVGIYRTSFASWLVNHAPLWSLQVFQQGALWFELLAPALFFWRPLRPVGIVWGMGFHIVITLSMYKVGMFNLQMMCFFVLFLSPAMIRWLRLGSLPITARPHPLRR